MNILDILRHADGGGAAKTLAQTFSIAPAEADAVLASVIPQLSQRIERNTLSRGGVADIVGAIGMAARHGDLSSPQALASDSVKQDGIAFLDQILWSKDKSRGVAHAAARSSGVSEDLIKQMLPAIAAMMMGGLAKGAAGGLGDILSKIPGLPGGDGFPGGAPQMPGGGMGGGLGGPARTAPSGGGGSWGGSAGNLPAPGGDFGGQSPLPIPGNAPRGGGSAPNQYDDLSDIIRRGGQQAPGGGSGGGAGGGGLANIIRTILGAILGFQSRGLLSWIIRYVVVRYGANIVRTLLSILLGRRM